MHAVRAADSPSGLTITFGDGQVIVAGVDDRAEIIVFGIAIGRHGHSAMLRREVRTATDDDGDGQVTFEIRDIPVRSVWVVVDAKSGSHTVATPSGEAPGILNLPDDVWRGNHAHVDVARSWAEVLVVRPGVGAWTLRSAAGGSNDFDAIADRKIRLRLDRMERLTGTDKGPSHALPKDLIVLVDPQTLDTFVSEAK